jgi:hypothetical protein
MRVGLTASVTPRRTRASRYAGMMVMRSPPSGQATNATESLRLQDHSDDRPRRERAHDAERKQLKEEIADTPSITTRSRPVGSDLDQPRPAHMRPRPPEVEQRTISEAGLVPHRCGSRKARSRQGLRGEQATGNSPGRTGQRLEVSSRVRIPHQKISGGGSQPVGCPLLSRDRTVLALVPTAGPGPGCSR